MSRQTIPAQTIITCDCCGCVLDNRNAKRSGAVAIKAAHLDYSGAAVADASQTFDLCDSCLPAVSKAVAAVFTEKRAK